MKFIPVFILLILGLKISYGQSFGRYNYGENYKVFLGKTAKLDVSGELNSPVQSKLYISIPKSDFDFENRVEDILKYKDVEFLVDSVFSFEVENEFSKSKVFRLKSKNTKDVLYYIYKFDDKSEFLITELDKVNFEKYCESLITKEKDDFTNEITLSSPLGELGTIIKSIKRGKETYFLRIGIKSEGIYRGKGVIILFTDGSKWSRPNEKVDVNYNEGFENSVFMVLTLADLEVFKKKTIKKIRLYIHDKDVEVSKGEKFRTFVSIVSLKK
jgi:hypothetical protein